jgi:hypothetical protein
VVAAACYVCLYVCSVFCVFIYLIFIVWQDRNLNSLQMDLLPNFWGVSFLAILGIDLRMVAAWPPRSLDAHHREGALVPG